MIYTHSRYMNTQATNDDGITTFKIRRRLSFNLDGAKIHKFVNGDRLDGLAMTYYNTPHLWWVILEANPQYPTELHIKYGDDLVIPSYDEVIRCLKY